MDRQLRNHTLPFVPFKSLYSRLPIPWLLVAALGALTVIFLLPQGASASAPPPGPCEDGYVAPTPVDVPVTSVPITVTSTTADYFVLYVKTSNVTRLANAAYSDTSTLAVSVTLGADGTTTLADNLAPSAADKYVVKKYSVAQPGDLDGDCVDDLTELAKLPTYNPVNPLKAIDIDLGAAAIDSLATFQKLSLRGVMWKSGDIEQLKYTEWVNYSILNAEADNPTVLFMNTNLARVHGWIEDRVGIQHGKVYSRGAIAYHPNIEAPDGSSGIYRFGFDQLDDGSFENVQKYNEILAANMPVLDNNLFYFPSTKVQVSNYNRDKSKFDASRINVLTEADIFGKMTYIALNQGGGYGRLRLMKEGERPSPFDVAIYETLPNDLPRVAGTITTVRQTPLSHVNLRAIQNNLPNAYIKGALQEDAITALLGSYVYFAATADGYTIRAATKAEVDKHFESLRPKNTQTLQSDLTKKTITSLSNVSFADWTAFGVKAANVAELTKLSLPDGTTPVGYAVPFYFYVEFMKQATLGKETVLGKKKAPDEEKITLPAETTLAEAVTAMLAHSHFKSDADIQEEMLDDLRKAIKNATSPAWIITALENLHAQYPDGQSLRYRSSTNNEDLPSFSGAGLYSSKTQTTEETTEDGIDKSIKQVWASLWNYRAFLERDFYRVDHTTVFMGVLVHPNYSDEPVNGVAVSYDPITFQDDFYYVNSQKGEDLVTNPEAHSQPEQLLLGTGGEAKILSRSNLVTSNKLLMSAAQMRQLRSNLETIHNHFRTLYGIEDGEDFAIEIEFKITAANKLAIKQARPWIFPKPFVQPPTLNFGLNHTVSSGKAYVLIVPVTHTGSNLTLGISGPDAGHFSDYTHADIVFLEPQEYDSPADANRDGVYEIDFTASASGGGTTTGRLRFTVANDELKSLAQQQWDQLSQDQRATLIPEVNSDLLKPNFANLVADVKAIVVRFARQGLLTSQGPTVSISGGGGITEGGSASFTVSANPAPAASLDVKVTVTQSGDYGATTGQRTVTIPTSGSVSFTVGTTDDQTDEANGSVTATVNAGSGYTVSASQGAATVGVSDNDDPKPQVSITSSVGGSEGESVSFTISANPAPTTALPVSVTVATAGDFGFGSAPTSVTIPTGGSLTLTIATTDDKLDEPDGSVTLTLNAGSDYTLGTTSSESVEVTDDDGSTPEISISGGSGITEGGDASFTVTANPAPASSLDVKVTITQSGDYGATTGQRTVTVPTSGSVAFTVGTTDDQADESDGSVTATLVDGADYDLGPTKTATVTVSDNDDGPDYTDYQTVVDYLIQVRDNPENTAVQGNPAHILKWNRVLAAIGYDSGESPMAESEIHANAARWPDSPFKAPSVYLKSLGGQPVVSVTGGSGITEGGSASFTVSASPAPSANLDVSVTVTQSGDYGATTGQRTVTIPTSGSVTFTVGTTNDQADEADGSVTATVDAGSGYTVSSSQSAATVSVSDNDDAPRPVVSVSGGSGITEGGSASFTVSASPAPSANLDVKVTVTQSGDYGATTGQRTVTIPTSGSVSFTVATTDDSTDESDGSVTATLVDGAAYDLGASKTATVTVSDNDDPTPVVSVTGGSGITEGGSASFTVSASPAPSANLDVKVTITQSGNYGATTGQRTVTIPTSGSVTFTVGTTDDSADEADGSVTATVDAGTGYTVSSSQGAATVSVADNDDAPRPVVSVSGGSGITEGGSASFTVSASPAPSANLDVKVTVTQSGDYGATTGQRTVTIPTSGSVSFTVGTTDDSADETDGSVTATVDADSGYTVSSSQGAATVNVSDNDDAPRISVTVEDSSATEGGVLTFRVRLSAASTEEVRIRWYTAPAYDRVDDRAHRSDYQASEGELVFAAGVTELTAEVLLEQDNEDEPDEYFAVEAFLPGSFFTPDAVGTMTIVDDD